MTLLHPFMPFITEELWQHLPHRGESIMLAPWPAGDAAKLDEGAEEALSLVMEVVKACRNLRTQVNVGPGKKAALVLLSDSETSQATLEACRGYMMSLATAENITIGPAGGEKPRQAVTAVVRGVEVYLPLAGLVDMDKERQRLEKEIQKVQGGNQRYRKEAVQRGLPGESTGRGHCQGGGQAVGCPLPASGSSGSFGSVWRLKMNRQAEFHKEETAKERLAFEETLARVSSFGIKPGLKVIQALLKEVGDPQAGLAAIHITGTNGKDRFRLCWKRCCGIPVIGRDFLPHLICSVTGNDFGWMGSWPAIRSFCPCWKG